MHGGPAELGVQEPAAAASSEETAEQVQEGATEFGLQDPAAIELR